MLHCSVNRNGVRPARQIKCRYTAVKHPDCILASYLGVFQSTPRRYRDIFIVFRGSATCSQVTDAKSAFARCKNDRERRRADDFSSSTLPSSKLQLPKLLLTLFNHRSSLETRGFHGRRSQRPPELKISYSKRTVRRFDESNFRECLSRLIVPRSIALSTFERSNTG